MTCWDATPKLPGTEAADSIASSATIAAPSIPSASPAIGAFASIARGVMVRALARIGGARSTRSRIRPVA